MARLVGGNRAADLRQRGVARLGSVARGVAMGDLGGALLEGGVNEAQVGVVVCLGIHARANQVLDGDLNCRGWRRRNTKDRVSLWSPRKTDLIGMVTSSAGEAGAEG